MTDYRDFDRIKILTIIEGTLVNTTPIRIGVGEQPPLETTVDLAVYRVNGIPCIPGSSLKGVFRSFIESLAMSLGYAIHDPWDDVKIKQEAKTMKFCPICCIFGSTEIASHVRIYDAFPTTVAQTFLKTSVSIDREFGGARPGLLFTEELVNPGTRWNFRMDVINIEIFPHPNRDDPRAVLIRALINTLTSLGLNVGARKTVGYGLIKLEKGRWTIYSFEDGEVRKKREGSIN